MSIKVSKLQAELVDSQARVRGAYIEIEVLKQMLRASHDRADSFKPLFTLWGREYGWRTKV